MIPIDYYLWLSAILFTIGVMGVLYRRNAIIVFMCIELMLNAVNLIMVAFSNYINDPAGHAERARRGARRPCHPQGAGLQVVIDVQRAHPAPVPSAQRRGRGEQRGRIRAAGKRDAQPGAVERIGQVPQAPGTRH